MLKLGQGKKTLNAARQHKGLHVSCCLFFSSIIILIFLKVMWEYLSTYSKAADANTAGGNKLYYRADFADYMVSLGERSAALGFVRN